MSTEQEVKTIANYSKLITHSMKQGSLKIYYMIKAFHSKSIYLLIPAIIIAVFCLPTISSFAYYKVTNYYYLQKIQQLVRKKSEPAIEIRDIYVTAYSSSLDETDGNPCITASGYNLCQHNKENVVACNFLPFGTKVRFPELDPDKIYTVVDRMNERFDSRMDIWMRSKTKAKIFGIKKLKVEIIYDN